MYVDAAGILNVLIEDDLNTETPTVTVKVNGTKFGDCLTDNAYVEDFYRYHDAFHFTFAALLNWSPTVSCYVKSPYLDDSVDKTTKSIDESLAIAIFSFARDADFYETSEVDECLVDVVKRLTRSLEISKYTTIDDWINVIRTSCKLFKFLIIHKRAEITIDLAHKTISWK